MSNNFQQKNLLIPRICSKQISFAAKYTVEILHVEYLVGLLICTLISENQGLFQTLEKFQVLQTWTFFQFVTWIFFQVYGINLAFF